MFYGQLQARLVYSSKISLEFLIKIYSSSNEDLDATTRHLHFFNFSGARQFSKFLILRICLIVVPYKKNTSIYNIVLYGAISYCCAVQKKRHINLHYSSIWSDVLLMHHKKGVKFTLHFRIYWSKMSDRYTKRQRFFLLYKTIQKSDFDRKSVMSG